MNATRSLTVCALCATLVAPACADEQLTKAPELDDYEPGGVEELDCMPTLDGRIDADQMTPAFDVPINYRVSPAGEERPVEMPGYEDQQGNRVWDFSTNYDTDQSLQISARELGDQWYAADFPDAQFSTILDPDLGLDAVYSHDGDTLYLHGYASATEDSPYGKTLVVYEEPVTAYDFPLEVGKSWSSTGEVRDGMLRDLPYSADETYEFTVDAVGHVWLPDIRFENALRVRTEVTIDMVAGDPLYNQQYQFLFECFGEVMRLAGPQKELNDEFAPEDYVFDTAVEMRRLGF